ncbi:16S rRNA (guanine(966)-N(2))-methyltransferase RsmD [Rhodococcus sp. NPDC059234]|uniref:16S rRNA (guanine(966)-N(2))-methyltransferase RsmD n=1 Tax=Rhodococcus sp. NPDC059234 TaxID=3346781 RepID=UPI00366FE288
MTRIVAGAAGGRRLRVPTAGTRPTSERVREALFSALDARVELDGAAVLDLYAGSGALGLEALSRGAEHVVLVESNAKAAAVVRENVAAVGLAGAVVRTAPVAAVVAGAPDREYDIVFLDPPYALGEDELGSVLAAIAAGGWIGEGSMVVVERATRSADTVWPAGLEVERVRKYGDTRVEIACYGLQS